MKILIVNDLGTDTGGAERVSIELRNELRRRGDDARLFSSDAVAIPGAGLRADELCRGASGRLRSALSVANPFAYLALCRTLASFRPHIVHLRMFHWQLSPLVLRALRPWPVLLHSVNYDLICPMNTKVLPSGRPCHHRPGTVCLREGCLGPAGLLRAAAQRRLAAAWLTGTVDRHVTNSHWVRRRLEAEGVRVDGVIWNGVPVTEPRPPIDDAPPAIGFAGRLVPKKGADLLIACMPEIRRAAPNVTLHIAGDGPMRPRLEALAHELGVANAVRFLGHLSSHDMQRAFARIWVQAAPSAWEEPFGLVAAEAMMRATAAVVSDAGGLGEQVVHGHTGLLAPPGDRTAWTQALLRILSDPQLAERLGQAGRELALREFTFARFVDRIQAVYAEMLASSRVGTVNPAPPDGP
jgi:glycosyltransferase involved in cell wall biosynthesis